MQAAQGAELSDVAPPSIEDVFSLRRPRDFRAGLSSGLKSVGKGILGGVVGLLAAPIVGAATDGLPGLAKGVAAGVAGAVLLPVTGVTIGVLQVARGVANQPTALLESLRGKAWDQEQRTWVEQPQCALTTYDAAAAAAAAAHWHRRVLAPLPSSAELDYYALLEVPKDASAEQIKQQYYKLARRHHPDKNAGDPEAHERFQQLGHAYQVLSTPALRKRYDAVGASALSDVDWLEPGAFFAALFGSELFDHLVGELAIATMAKTADDDCSAGISPAELRALQKARSERLVVLLAALLRRYTEGDVEGFKLAMRLEAERLAAASFGVTLLHCIGRVYSRQADIFLGGLLRGTFARVKLGRDSVRSHLDIANAALRVISHQEKVAAFDRQCEQRRQQQQHQQCQQSEQLLQQRKEDHRQQVHQHHQQVQHQLLEQQQQQQQRVLDQLDMAVVQLQPTDAADSASVTASGAPPAEALNAWDAVWFGNNDSIAAGPAAAGTPAMQEEQQQQQWHTASSCGKHPPAGSLGGCVLRNSKKCEGGLPAKQQQQSLQTDTSGLQIPIGVPEHNGGGGSSSAQNSSCSEVNLAAEPRAAGLGGHAAAAGIDAAGIETESAAAPAAASSHAPTAAGFGSIGDASTHAAAAAAAAADAAAADSSSLDELLQRAQLEDAGMDLMLQAMWAANVVDTQATLGGVCRAVLQDRRTSRAVRRLRAAALRELGAIFCAAEAAAGSSSSGSQGAKQQMQAAYEVVMARQMAEQEDADLQL